MTILTREELRKEIRESREFEETHLKDQFFAITSLENINTLYDTQSGGTPYVCWGLKTFIPYLDIRLRGKYNEKIADVVAQVRKEVEKLGFILEGSEETPFIDKDGNPYFYDIETYPQCPLDLLPKTTKPAFEKEVA